MLDFLNLRDDAEIMLLILTFGSFFLTMGLARLSIFSDKEKDVFAIAMLVVGFVSLGIACVPGFTLLITFRLRMILKVLIIALALGGGFYGLFYGAFFRSRALKYRKNPLMQEILAFCRNHRVEAVLCLQDGVVFYETLLNEEFCKGSKEERKVNSKTTEDDVRKGFFRPNGMQTYTNTPCIGRIRFADRNYPNLPNVTFFGQALAKELNGFKAASHYISTRYETTGTIYITKVHEDCFVYSKDALHRLNTENARKPKPPKQKQKQIQQNHWD